MKKNILVIATIIFIYLVLVTFDALTRPITTSEQTGLATQYLVAKNLPHPPIDFYHDGCTSYPDYLLWHDFEDACLAHDIAYWAGGDLDLKDQADLAFRDAVVKTGPLGNMFSFIMYHAVHNLGDNFVSHTLGSNWGYGWNE